MNKRDLLVLSAILKFSDDDIEKRASSEKDKAEIIIGLLEKEALEAPEWLSSAAGKVKQYWQESPELQRFARNTAISTVPGIAAGLSQGDLGQAGKLGLATGLGGGALAQMIPDMDYLETLKGLMGGGGKKKDTGIVETGYQSDKQIEDKMKKNIQEGETPFSSPSKRDIEKSISDAKREIKERDENLIKERLKKPVFSKGRTPQETDFKKFKTIDELSKKYGFSGAGKYGSFWDIAIRKGHEDISKIKQEMIQSLGEIPEDPYEYKKYQEKAMAVNKSINDLLDARQRISNAVESIPEYTTRKSPWWHQRIQQMGGAEMSKEGIPIYRSGQPIEEDVIRGLMGIKSFQER